MADNKVAEKIKEYSIEEDGQKYLRCKAAFKIAEELDADVATIGQTCNEEGVKIQDCQLGCF